MKNHRLDLAKEKNVKRFKTLICSGVTQNEEKPMVFNLIIVPTNAKKIVNRVLVVVKEQFYPVPSIT